MRLVLIFILYLSLTSLYALPSSFIYLREHVPSILQDIRYAGFHNFIGRPIAGYVAPECILTTEAAKALANVQKELQKQSMSLKVYDCYRPTQAVADFVTWSKDNSHQEMKHEFYPDITKADLFKLGYVGDPSSHSRGSTVDLTIVKIPSKIEPHYNSGDKLISCKAPYNKRYKDTSIDMGTGYDCMDELSHALNPHVAKIAQQHRLLLRQVMIKNGFIPYENEWWHFTLKNEPYPKTYFNFLIEK